MVICAVDSEVSWIKYAERAQLTEETYSFFIGFG